jgi:hypothetical protein
VVLCGQAIRNRANNKYDPEGLHRCQREDGHTGTCAEFHYLEQLRSVAPRVADKIARDATKTTGASWKSEDAGPNRISRWTMLLTDDELLALGIRMAALKPWVVAKLRQKAATYEDCMSSARYLAWSVYRMEGAPDPDPGTRAYLEDHFGPMVKGATGCLICRAPLRFALFQDARRGKAEIETAHANPREHTPGNVGFAHRHCNIAQGDKDLDGFYDWITGILERAGRITVHNLDRPLPLDPPKDPRDVEESL